MKKGFTLAETLITLVIIGVVAALTVPTLIVKYQKEQTVTRLKKAYSALAQTTQKAIADYGPVETWEIGEEGNGNDAVAFANKYIIPYLNIMKNCQTENSGSCNYKYQNRKSGGIETFENFAKFYLNDGSLIALSIENHGQAQTIGVWIDINGQKKPNKSGKDLFSFRYILNHNSYAAYKGRFIPNCMSFNKNFCMNDSNSGCRSGDGLCCSALIVRNNWEIADDYPW